MALEANCDAKYSCCDLPFPLLLLTVLLVFILADLIMGARRDILAKQDITDTRAHRPRSRDSSCARCYFHRRRRDRGIQVLGQPGDICWTVMHQPIAPAVVALHRCEQLLVAPRRSLPCSEVGCEVPRSSSA